MDIDFKCSRVGNSVVNGGIWLKFELIQAFIHALFTCQIVEDPIKNKGARVATTFLTL